MLVKDKEWILEATTPIKADYLFFKSPVSTYFESFSCTSVLALLKESDTVEVEPGRCILFWPHAYNMVGPAKTEL